MTQRKGLFICLLAVFISFAFIGCDFNKNNNVTNPKAAIIGDSVFDLSGAISDYLEDLSGEQYRDYSVSGERMSDIIDQYYDAFSDDSDIRTIIMDGGANDILQTYKTECSYGVSAQCKQYIDDLVGDAAGLLDQMETDGVQNVVWLGYYNLPGSNAKLNDAVDYAMEEVITMCGSSSANCYFVESRDSFEGHSEYIKNDDLHPTDAGSEVLANLIWDVMVDNNIEQNQ
ncbi:MAG: SGNH/GDSL hydrolase family protein [bacterium]|nr:SGNH/GDSL hydrolase family protein [bacterium]